MVEIKGMSFCFASFKMYKLVAIIGFMMILTARFCGSAGHEGQLSQFDGNVYDSMLVSHSTLVGLRPALADKYPQYIDEFNRAANSYNAALVEYDTYRLQITNDNAILAKQVATVGVDVVALQNHIQDDLPANPAVKAQVRRRMRTLQATPNGNGILINILGSLQAGATIAAAIPPLSPYAVLASALISVAEASASNYQKNLKEPINLAKIGPITLVLPPR